MPVPEATAAWSSAIRLARYEAHAAMTPHHHDQASLSIIVDGSYEERIRGRASTHGAGSLLFYPAFEEHSQQFSGGGALQILITPGRAALDFLDQRLSLAKAPFSQSAVLANLGLRLAAELTHQDRFSGMVLHGLVLETVGHFCRSVDPPQTIALSWLREARSFIETRFSENLTIEELARVVGRHPVHLARAFRHAFGETIGDYIRSARLREAARLLLASRLPIGEIAVLCGFCDQAHLSRSFKRAFGTTPGVYRNSSR